jgi:hypothetical protein
VSEFHWGDASLPHYYRSTQIVLNWLESIGHTYNQPTETQVLEGRYIAQSMDDYTDSGEIYDAGDFVVVRLGRDLFYSTDEDLILQAASDAGLVPDGDAASSSQDDLLEGTADSTDKLSSTQADAGSTQADADSVQTDAAE